MKSVIIELDDLDKERLLNVISELGIGTQKNYLLTKIAEDERKLEEGKTNHAE